MKTGEYGPVRTERCTIQSVRSLHYLKSWTKLGNCEMAPPEGGTEILTLLWRHILIACLWIPKCNALSKWLMKTYFPRLSGPQGIKLPSHYCWLSHAPLTLQGRSKTQCQQATTHQAATSSCPSLTHAAVMSPLLHFCHGSWNHQYHFLVALCRPSHPLQEVLGTGFIVCCVHA